MAAGGKHRLQEGRWNKPLISLLLLIISFALFSWCYSHFKILLFSCCATSGHGTILLTSRTQTILIGSRADVLSQIFYYLKWSQSPWHLLIILKFLISIEWLDYRNLLITPYNIWIIRIVQRIIIIKEECIIEIYSCVCGIDVEV